jgi:4-hydroxybenzoate polyprenyltransferase
MNPAALARALRPHQWVKNLFVLAAVVFARADKSVIDKPADYSDVWRSLLAFGAFCLGASAIYLVNDVLDVESDRAHPEKRLRPIASGALSVRMALAAALVAGVGAYALATLAAGSPHSVSWVLLGYMLLNLAYSLRLKHVVLLDVFCIATGFLLRVKAGGLAAHYHVSQWLMLCTLFLALFLGLCKRRAEIDLLGEERGSHRANLRHYTLGFLDQMTTLLAAVTVVFYTMYTVSPENADKFGPGHHLIYSVPFVVFGLARYLFLVDTQRGGGSPTRVLLGGDALFVVNALGWLGVVLAVVYGGW